MILRTVRDRSFNVDTMMLYISAMNQTRRLKFSSYVHLPSILIHLSDSVQCRRGYYFLAWGLYFSLGTHYDYDLAFMFF